MKTTTIAKTLLLFSVMALCLHADPAFAQNFNADQGVQATFRTGLGAGVDTALGTVVKAARIIAIAGGLIQMFVAGYQFSKGERDAMDALKGVLVGFVIIGAGVGIATALLGGFGG
jgi:hypothetical protein